MGLDWFAVRRFSLHGGIKVGVSGGVWTPRKGKIPGPLFSGLGCSFFAHRQLRDDLRPQDACGVFRRMSRTRPAGLPMSTLIIPSPMSAGCTSLRSE